MNYFVIFLISSSLAACDQGLQKPGDEVSQKSPVRQENLDLKAHKTTALKESNEDPAKNLAEGLATARAECRMGPSPSEPWAESEIWLSGESVLSPPATNLILSVVGDFRYLVRASGELEWEQEYQLKSLSGATASEANKAELFYLQALAQSKTLIRAKIMNPTARIEASSLKPSSTWPLDEMPCGLVVISELEITKGDHKTRLNFEPAFVLGPLPELKWSRLTSEVGGTRLLKGAKATVLASTSPELPTGRLLDFEQSLRLEGSTLIIETRWAESQFGAIIGIPAVLSYRQKSKKPSLESLTTSIFTNMNGDLEFRSGL